MTSESLCLEIHRLANPQRAAWDQNYHKSKRQHYGVNMPQINQLAKQTAKGKQEDELLRVATDMWKTNIFDCMIFAARLLSHAKPSPKLWATLHLFLQDVDGWALEDGLAHAAWKCILADEMLLDQLDEWARHPNFWMRRAVLVYTLPFAKPNRNPERMLQWAQGYADDPEWFIQKAIGWWLRVLGEHNPERVAEFLEIHWSRLKGVARKEATRKLSEQFKAQHEHRWQQR